jgi:hypothetical protein
MTPTTETPTSDDLDKFFIGCLWATGKANDMTDAELTDILRETYGVLAEEAADLARTLFAQEDRHDD